MTMHIPRADTRPQAVLPRLPHSAPEDQDGGPLFSSSCGWAPPPHGLGQRQERDAETKWQVRVGRSLDRLEAGAGGERAAPGARTGGFPGREAALGQRPLADSAAAAAALRRVSWACCCGHVGSRSWAPGKRGERSPAQRPGKVRCSQSWVWERLLRSPVPFQCSLGSASLPCPLVSSPVQQVLVITQAPRPHLSGIPRSWSRWTRSGSP